MYQGMDRVSAEHHHVYEASYTQTTLLSDFFKLLQKEIAYAPAFHPNAMRNSRGTT